MSKIRFHHFINSVRFYLADTTGAIMIIFAFSLPVLVGMVGIATDSALAYLERERLSRSCDAAALAAASSSVETNAVLYDRFTRFFEANYPPDRYGIAQNIRLYMDGNLIAANNEEVLGDILRAEIDVSYDVTFGRIFGISNIDFSVACEVQREIRQLEVAMVLDVTGSMAGSRIQALREASTDFINIMFDRVPEDGQIRIALVPYAAAVNVGDEILANPAMFDPPEEDGLPGSPTLVYDPTDPTQWAGCVMARETPYDYLDTDANSLNGGPWQGFKHPDITAADARDDNDYIDDDGNYQLNLAYTEGNNRRSPNLACPELDPIQPLISNRELLLDLVTGSDRTNGDDDGDPGLRYWSRGGTFGNLGMVWGERVLSPDPPFTQGAAYEDVGWRKAVLMMTDGENQIYRQNFTAYGEFSGIDDPLKLGTSNTNDAAAEATRRFNLTCENMKDNGIVIYTIIFGSAANNGPLRTAYEACASDTNKFFPAAGSTELINAFQRIAKELSNLHLRS